MSQYLRPILRYGLVTPVLFQGVLLGMAAFGITKLQATRALKEERYQEEIQRRAAVNAIEAKVAPKRKTFADQKLILQSDASQIFTRTLDSILPKYKSIELERIGMVFLLDKGKINRTLLADATRVKSGFEGGFGPMQETLLQVESLMPQTFLEELKITRKTDLVGERRERLSFEMTHTCWKAGEAKP
jgi:hypothetical protein